MKTPDEAQGSAELTVDFDQGKADQFIGRMMAAMNGAAVTMMTSIGHKTRLFDVMSEMPPSTSEEIASRAGLNERYVREWLAAMVMGQVVEYDETTRRYLLPPEHAAWLTRKAKFSNFAVATQFVPVLAQTEEKIVDCFSHGRGLGYDAYPCFHAVMAEESEQTTVNALLEHILPLVPGIMERLESGIRVLDVGCGEGRAMMRLAERFPQSEFVGLDLCEDAMQRTQERARVRGFRNLSFDKGDAAVHSPKGKFDLITAFDAVHDQRDPMGVIRNVHSMLADGGVFLMQDIAGSASLMKNTEHPLSAFLYTISCMHCMTVSLGQGGQGLGTMWGEETAREFLTAAGFSSHETHRLPHDILNVYFVARK